MMHTTLKYCIAVLVVLLSYPNWTFSQELPKDPFQREATLYLAGKLGEINLARAAVYRKGLAQGVRANSSVWVTAYYGTEPSGVIDGHGKPCTMRTAAANELPQYSWVWSKEFGLRQVLDTGAASNDRFARHPPRKNGRAVRRPAAFWVDIWYPKSSCCKWGGSKVMCIAVIR